jgi:hypothetical protein
MNDYTHRCLDPSELDTFNGSMICQKCDPRLCSPILSKNSQENDDDVYHCRNCGQSVNSQLVEDLFKSLATDLVIRSFRVRIK